MMVGFKKLLLAMGLAGALSTSAMAGSIFLTGHDVDLHGGADGYDVAILDFLRGSGTASEIARGSYNIGLIRSDDAINPAFGFVGGVLGGSPPPFGTITTADPTQFADGAAFSAFLSGIDVLVVASQVNCGGCDFSEGDSNALNGFSAQIASFFNAGGDIWGNTSANLATYYDFLPPSVTASGPPISGSSGFVATAAGTAIGITDEMINGDPTHNRFVDFAPVFTVFETRPITGGGTEIISIGVRDGTIVDDGIVTDDGGTDDGGTVPEPATLGLLGLGALAVGLTRRRKQK